MAEQNDSEARGYGSDDNPLSGLVKTYIDEQVKNAVKQHAEPSPKRKKWRNSWRAASPLTKASMMLAAGVAVATIGYTIAAWRTLKVMKEISKDSSAQTAQLIDAANQIKSAAWQFKGSTQGIDGNLGNAVVTLQTQADNSKKSLQASIDNFHLDQRAWVGINEIATPPQIHPGLNLAPTIFASNTGKTPAFHVVDRSGWAMLTVSEHYDPATRLLSIAPDQQGVISPNGGRQFVGTPHTITQSESDAINAGTSVVYVFGEITYEDSFHGRHRTKFSLKMQKSTTWAYRTDGPYNDEN
jgi:hypothetical protein